MPSTEGELVCSLDSVEAVELPHSFRSHSKRFPGFLEGKMRQSLELNHSSLWIFEPSVEPLFGIRCHRFLVWRCLRVAPVKWVGTLTV